MKKKLEDLSREEWGKLYPVKLVEYNKDWPGIYNREKHLLLGSFGKKVVKRIEHFGSTSIPGMPAKPYIDILIGVPEDTIFDEDLILRMKDLDYKFFGPSGNGADYLIFVKGYNLNKRNEQVFHIHMCPCNHHMWEQIKFRNYLIQKPERAAAYVDLKMELAKEFKNDRVSYRIGKSEFIKKTLELANEEEEVKFRSGFSSYPRK